MGQWQSTWQAFDGAKTNFLLYHKVDNSQIVVSRSTEDHVRSLRPDQVVVPLRSEDRHGVSVALVVGDVLGAGRARELRGEDERGHRRGDRNASGSSPHRGRYRSRGTDS